MKQCTLNATSDEIRILMKDLHEGKLFMRLLCLLQIAKGKSAREVSREEEIYSHVQILEFVEKFNQQGLLGITDKIHP